VCAEVAISQARRATPDSFVSLTITHSRPTASARPSEALQMHVRFWERARGETSPRDSPAAHGIRRITGQNKSPIWICFVPKGKSRILCQLFEQIPVLAAKVLSPLIGLAGTNMGAPRLHILQREAERNLDTSVDRLRSEAIELEQSTKTVFLISNKIFVPELDESRIAIVPAHHVCYIRWTTAANLGE
jgi:hypothetical protein